MQLHARCPYMIPAERCIVIVYPSIMEREKLRHPTTTQAMPVPDQLACLEERGVDEIECGWEGELEVSGHEGPNSWHAEGDCPRCGQTILIDVHGTSTEAFRG